MRSKPHRTLTTLALAVLRLLRERPMHPYDLHKLIREHATDQVVKVRAGSLYHTVTRLHRLELVEPVEVGRAGRRPERTVYAITDAGREEYAANLRDLVRWPEEEYPVFAAAVEMLSSLDAGEAARLLEMRCVSLEARIAAQDQVTAGLTKRGLSRVSLLELEYAQSIAQAELRWVRGVVDDIHSGALTWDHDCKEPMA